mmetsp:Transcript_10453/g.13830  ORF Transcript_10453/g.13830 Transcript_10453/m.13830 type:complete len:484 (+) Transcript_10453:153-1604(+)
MLQLAHASVELGHSVQLITSRCDANHCFAPLKPTTGTLYPYLKVWGEWIPQDFLGMGGRAICSTLRVLYLSYRLSRPQSKHEPEPDIIVMDVLPTPLALLQWWMPNSSLLFYCHFPDQLLTQNKSKTTKKSFYRSVLDFLEERTMPFADSIVVNSKFTQQTVLRTFPSLQKLNLHLPVLYPALDTTALDSNKSNINSDDKTPKYPIKPLVSLNRYERKKNVLLLLQAVQWIIDNQQDDDHDKVKIPPIIIAGGYDVHNVENVEYRGELQQYVNQHKQLEKLVQFQQSISDEQRTLLLKEALAVVYTPTNEHFGIVPLEAMYCKTPVVAVNTGGPTETVLDGQTGFLCDPTPQAFGKALLTLIRQDPQLTADMGQAGRQHVLRTFGQERMVEEWNTLVNETVQKGKKRQEKYNTTFQFIGNLIQLSLDALMTVLFFWLLTLLLRQAGILHSSKESLLGGLQLLFGIKSTTFYDGTDDDDVNGEL